jgi:hypothetical protein
MAYSIKTKDGIVINNIPDDIAPDSQALKDRVAQERARISGFQPEAVNLPADVIPVSQPESPLSLRAQQELSPEQQAQLLKARQGQLGSSMSLEQASAIGPSAATSRERSLASMDPIERSLVEDIGPLRAAAIGAGRGFTTIGRAVGLADPESESERASIESLRSVRPVSVGAGEILGESAPFLPLGVGAAAIKSALPRAAAVGLTGALEGGLISRGEGKDVGDQFKAAGIGGTVAGALELGLPVLGRIGGKIIRRVNNKAPAGAVIDALGNPSDELLDALSKSGQSFDDIVKEAKDELVGEAVDPKQAARKAFLKSQGLEPTRAQVTRNAADFQAQQEAAKTSNRIRDALESQDAILTSRFDNEILKTSGDAVTPTSSVVDALTEKASILDQNISDLYRVAREVAPDEKNVRFTSLASKLRQSAQSDRVSGGAVRAIIGDLQNKGVLDESLKVVGRIDVKTAEDTRKLMNELFDPQNPFRNALLRNMKDSLDDDVFRAAGDDVFKQARKAKADFESDLARSKVSKFDKRGSNLVRDILENKVDPDKLAEQVVFGKKWRPQDLGELKNYISTTQGGKKAFNDLRAETLQSIKERSFIGAADDAGNQVLSRDKLQKSLAAIGSGKMNILFTKPERKFLKNMLEISKLREPVRGTALGKGPSAQAIAGLEKTLSDLPIIGNLVQFLDIDSQGRMLIKSNPKRLPTITTPSPLRAAIAAPAGALAAAEEQEEER